MSLADLKKTVYYLRRNGLRDTCYAVCERLAQRKAVYRYEAPGEEVLKAQRARKFLVRPLFSVLVPLYRTPREYLTEMMDSVLGQTYGNLELILADATEDDSVGRAVRERMEASPEEKRVRYYRLKKNGGISENSNEALKYVTGDYVGLLDHDDLLAPDALYETAVRIEALAARGEKALILYSDEDKCSRDGSAYFEPHLKPDFNPDLLLTNNYICHFLVMERELIRKLGFRKEFDGAQDFDLVLRAVFDGRERLKGSIVHIPRALYHWRCHEASTAANPASKQYAYEAGRRAVQDTADRMGWKASAQHLKHLGYYRLLYDPDILSVRGDVGAVGGRLLCGGKVAGGAYDRTGKALYLGLKSAYSGYMNRAVLLQDVYAADIRLIRVSESCRQIFRQAVGVPYVPAKDGSFDIGTLPENADYRELSLRLGRALEEAGYLVCWDPGFSKRVGRTDIKKNVQRDGHEKGDGGYSEL